MLPLSGTVVLDFAHGYPGAYSTMFLGDFGAEVIRIDPPHGAAPGQDYDLEEVAAYNTMYRNKKSIIINLKSEEGQAVLHRLVKKADVLLEGFRPGVMDRLNAGYQALKEMNPRLIYCSLSGFGQDGPYVARPAHDMNYISLGGVLSLIGQRDGSPYLPSNFIADLAGAGLHGLVGILIALIARDRTGEGQFVDIAYLDSVISLLSWEAPDYFRTGIVPRRGETFNTGAVPWTNIYKCKDGEYITVACTEPHFWANICRALEKEDLIRLQTPPYAPSEEMDGAISELAEVFITKTRDEWSEFFKGMEVCFGPVRYLDETFSDPQVLHRHMVTEIDHPRIGKVRQIGLPLKLSATPGQVRSLGTPDGTDTEDILLKLQYTRRQIEELRKTGAVGFPE